MIKKTKIKEIKIKKTEKNWVKPFSSATFEVTRYIVGDESGLDIFIHDGDVLNESGCLARALGDERISFMPERILSRILITAEKKVAAAAGIKKETKRAVAVRATIVPRKKIVSKTAIKIAATRSTIGWISKKISWVGNPRNGRPINVRQMTHLLSRVAEKTEELKELRSFRH